MSPNRHLQHVQTVLIYRTFLALITRQTGSRPCSSLCHLPDANQSINQSIGLFRNGSQVAK